MIISKHLLQVFVIPEYNGRQNVVRRVYWAIRFADQGIYSDAVVETFLDIDNINNFIPANEIGDEQLLQWVFEAQGGEAFLSELQPYHESRIEYQKMCGSLEIYSEGFNLLTLDRSPQAIPSVVL